MKRFLKRLLGGSVAPPTPPVRNKALWSIGIFRGSSPTTLAEHSDARNPVMSREMVTDVPAAFVADPFLLNHDGTWHMFFEVLNRRNRRGEIGLATSHDLVTWRYQQVVLAEPFHLSYPAVFKDNGEYYMVPETHETRTVRLYRADPFPLRWTLEHTMLTGLPFADSTLVRHDGRWWMFTETSMRHQTLRLYFADDLRSSWTEHPASPIVHENPHVARPAGPLVSSGGRLLRFAQDCAARYGHHVNAFEVLTLTPGSYAERALGDAPVLTGSTRGWNSSRMHHVDAHQVGDNDWIAAVDGAVESTTQEIYS